MMNNSQTLCAALKTTVNQITSYVVQKILSSCFNSFQSQMVDLKKKRKKSSHRKVLAIWCICCTICFVISTIQPSSTPNRIKQTLRIICLLYLTQLTIYETIPNRLNDGLMTSEHCSSVSDFENSQQLKSNTELVRG